MHLKIGSSQHKCMMGCINKALKLGKSFTQQSCHLDSAKRVTGRKGCSKRCVKDCKERIEWLQRYQIDIDSKLKCKRKDVSQKQSWQKANKNIIMALSKVLDLHPDEVTEFLYNLTMQNFSQVLNPRRQQWNRCRVPLSHFEICDVFCDIFDKNGNVRSPYHPKSLRNLLGVLQLMLKERKEPNNGATKSLFGKEPNNGAKTSLFGKDPKSGKLSARAGIDEDSWAWRNGRRRRFKEYENYLLDGNGLGFIQGAETGLKPKDTYYDYSGNAYPFKNLNTSDGYFDAKSNPVAAGICIPDDGHCDHSKDPFAALFDPKGNPFLVGKGDDKCNPWDSKFPRRTVDLYNSVRRTQLTNLIKQVRDQSGIHRDYRDLVHGVRKLDLDKKYGHHSHKTKSHTKLHGTMSTEDPNKRSSTHPTHLYYGAQVPILAHEPFDSSKPWTWIRRHPKSARMDAEGHLLENSKIHRYKRLSVQEQLRRARQRNSVRTLYSDNESVSSRSINPSSKPPASKKNSTISKKSAVKVKK